MRNRDDKRKKRTRRAKTPKKSKRLDLEVEVLEERVNPTTSPALFNCEPAAM